jgi:tRNA (mo5U34)-methyltransferase
MSQAWQLADYPFAEALLPALAAVERQGHGDLEKWRAALGVLPAVENARYEFSPMLAVDADFSATQSTQLKQALLSLHPWRKGPFRLFDHYIDTEWRCDWKWQRVLPHIKPLAGRKVLDVGCGNGYYMWRMLGEGAAQVLGVDPMWLFRMQYEVLHFYFADALEPSQQVEMLPLGIDDVPEDTAYFDTVFSMGVLYHRRDPVQHIRQLLGQLRPGGELVLETLVIPADGDDELMPNGRYAQMRNVHALPTVGRLQQWLSEAGALDARCVDEADTTTEEQRQSAWMWFHSLPQYLDPSNPALTIEGHPAPRRAVLVARRAS